MLHTTSVSIMFSILLHLFGKKKVRSRQSWDACITLWCPLLNAAAFPFPTRHGCLWSVGWGRYFLTRCEGGRHVRLALHRYYACLLWDIKLYRITLCFSLYILHLMGSYLWYTPKMPYGGGANRWPPFLVRFNTSLPFKGIVQRDARGVESRLKRSALMNYLVALVYFFKLKEHSCERSKRTVFSVLTTIELNLLVEFTILCKRRAPYI